MTSKLWFIFVLTPVTLVLSSVQLSNDEVNVINSAQSSWKADYNFVLEHDINTLKKRLGINRISEKLLKFKNYFRTNKFFHRTKPTTSDDKPTIPKNYDARDALSNCSVIKSIKDQSNCGSCWAVAAAAMLSDRFCFATKGRINVNLSADHLVRCCHYCKGNDNGCAGGDIVKALIFLQKEGIVTGGDYGSEEGCMPYSIKPCVSSSKQKEISCINSNNTKSEKCYEKCTNEKYPIPYKDDKYHGISPYMYKNGMTYADDIKTDVMENGPLNVVLNVFEDLFLYKTGLYFHVTGKYLGGHAVRLIGWGVDNGTEYWLIANSWGTSWGQNGTAKIKRFNNGCNFGKYVLGILPVI